MKAITHKGEIGLVLSVKEATMLWKVFVDGDRSKIAWRGSESDGPYANKYLEFSTEEEFEVFDQEFWEELDTSIREIGTETDEIISP